MNIPQTPDPIAAAISGNGRHVLFIGQNLPAPFDMRTWQQATELAAHGYTVSVVCPRMGSFDAPHEKLENIAIFRHPLPFKGKGPFAKLTEYINSLMWEFMLAYRVFFSVGFDAIQGCCPPDNLFLIGGFFKIFFSKKYVFDMRGKGPELYETTAGKRDYLYKMARWCERMSFKTADIILTSDEDCSQTARERGQIAPEALFMVRTAPDLQRAEAVAASPALKAGRNYLVAFSGLILRSNGIIHLIEAARIIVESKKREDIHFLIIGGGEALEDLKKLAALQGVTDYMTFTGPVSKEALGEALATADICINTDENNPAADLEYMAHGRPVIALAPHPSSVNDTVLNARSGDAGDLAHKILLLLDDEPRRVRMAQSGRAYVEGEFNWAIEAPKLLAAYDALFSERKKD